MQVIILAAGMGTRLGKLTHEKPKCMLEFQGRTLLKRQLDLLNESDIERIIVVKGYKQEKINYPGLKYYINTDFRTTNMVESFLCSAECFDRETLLIYGDILFDKNTLLAGLQSNDDIGVIVDSDFEEYWLARWDSLKVDSEGLVIDDEYRIHSLGFDTDKIEDLQFRYVGMIKFSVEGLCSFRDNYLDLISGSITDEEISIRKKISMTEMLQIMIEKGNNISAIPIKRGWLEFDSYSDVDKYESWIHEGKMDRFIKI
tara:strand:+ start:169 stop:942 length:774 start_codon:yes stop_codon:yes gene_type:complete